MDPWEMEPWEMEPWEMDHWEMMDPWEMDFWEMDHWEMMESWGMGPLGHGSLGHSVVWCSPRRSVQSEHISQINAFFQQHLRVFLI